MDKANFENLRRMQKAVALMGECESRSLWWPANVANAREGLRAELSGVMLSCCKDTDFKDLYAYLGDFPETVAGNEQLFLYQAAAVQRRHPWLGKAINKILVSDCMETYFTEHAGVSGVEFALTALMLAKCAGTRCQTGEPSADYELFTGWLLSKCEIFPDMKKALEGEFRRSFISSGAWGETDKRLYRLYCPD